MQAIKNLIKKLVGKQAVSMYHRFLSWLAAVSYGNPSEKLTVIGVTGTNGKSTTVNLIAKILESTGHKTALTSTVSFKIGEREWLNDQKITMRGRFFLQKFLADAVKAGCTHAVIEVSSEGIEQFRHRYVHFDACVFTNLTPEHIEAHGGFENYKKAKLKLFRHLQDSPRKGKNPKIIIANADDAHAAEFTKFKVDKVVTFGKSSPDIRGSDLKLSAQGISFQINGLEFRLKLKGAFDFYNAMAATAAAVGFGIDLALCKQALEKVELVPGRVEVIQSTSFTAVVDYGYDPSNLVALYDTVNNWPHKKIIQVLGPTGGGRDKSRIPILGQIAGKQADVVIVTTDDPYDEDPGTLAAMMVEGAEMSGKILDQNLFIILDRRLAIGKALSLAETGDLVLVTGKGAEQKMAVKGGYIPWDDREVVRDELKKL